MTLRKHVEKRILNGLFETSVIEVYSHMFATIGNGYDWNENGELVGELVGEYDYLDIINESPIEYWQRLSEQYPDDMHLKAQVLKRQFIKDNIDAILDSNNLNDPFSDPYATLSNSFMRPDHVSYTYAYAFNFPDNIAKEYAQAMVKFNQYWMQALAHEYGYSSSKVDDESIAHWPKNAKKLRNRLKEQYEKLIDTGHFGT